MDVINGVSGDALTAYQLDSRIKKVEADHSKLNLKFTKASFIAASILALLVLALRAELIKLISF